jgi:superfamily I DNA/RNA helicase
VGTGRLGVLVSAGELAAAGAAVTAALPGAAIGEHAELENQVVVLTVRQAKGLEFDSVVVVEPDHIIAGSPRGLNDLYVALTRPTRRLAVMYTGQPPAVLAGDTGRSALREYAGS